MKKNRIKSSDIKLELGANEIENDIKKTKLRWCEYVMLDERKEDN